MLLIPRPSNPSSIKSRLAAGSYNTTYVFSGSSQQSTVQLTRIENVPAILTFVPNSSVTLWVEWALTSPTTNANNGGLRFLSYWVDANGAPALTYSGTVTESFNGVTISTSLDPKLNRHQLNVSTFGYGGGVTTTSCAVIQAIVIVRN